MSANIEQIKAMLERIGKTNISQKPNVDLDKEQLQLECTYLQQEQPDVELKEFTEKMDAWKARFNRPDDIPIKATMAFTARMFYQYPDVARQWYEQLPKKQWVNTRKEVANENTCK